MVRLKGNGKHYTLPIAKQISIPYGSIKRRKPLSTPRWTARISIPYGSIKRVIGNPMYSVLYQFQFLMVRLKDMAKRYRTSRGERISIPYGSIKRKIGVRHHLVHLFISIPYGSIKSSLATFFRWSEYISIPYGSIKSERQQCNFLGHPNFNSLWFD